MMREFVAACLAAALASGCGRPAAAVVTRLDLGGGKYAVEVETAGPAHWSVDRSSPGGAAEVFDADGGRAGRVRVEGGRLTVNGRPRGPLAEGDRVRIDVAGRVLVNGGER